MKKSKTLILSTSLLFAAGLSSCNTNEPIPEPKDCIVTVIGGTGGGTYKEGTICEVTSKKVKGKALASWKEGEKIVSTADPYSFTVTRDITLKSFYRDDDLSYLMSFKDKYDSSSFNGFDGGSWAGDKGGVIEESGYGLYSGEYFEAYMGATAKEDGSSKFEGDISKSVKPSWDGKSEVWREYDLTLPEVTDLSNKVLEFDLKFDNVAPGVKVELQDASGKSGFSGFASTYGTDEKGKTASESSYLNHINITQNPSSEWHHVLIDLKNYEGENSSILKGTKTIAFNFYNGSATSSIDYYNDIDYSKPQIVDLDNVYLKDRGKEVTVTLSGGTFDDGTTSKKALIGSRWQLHAKDFLKKHFGGWISPDNAIKVFEPDGTLTVEDEDMNLRAVHDDALDLSFTMAPQGIVNGWDATPAKKDRSKCTGTNTTGGADPHDGEHYYSLASAYWKVEPYDATEAKAPFIIRCAAGSNSDLTENNIVFDAKFDNLAIAYGVQLHGTYTEDGVKKEVNNVTENFIKDAMMADGSDFDGGNQDRIKASSTIEERENGWYHIEFNPLAFFTYGYAEGSSEYTAAFESLKTNDTIRIVAFTGGAKGTTTYKKKSANQWDPSKSVEIKLDNVFVEAKA